MTELWVVLVTIAVGFLLLQRVREFWQARQSRIKAKAMAFLIKEINPEERKVQHGDDRFVCESPSKGAIGFGDTPEEARLDWFDSVWYRMGLKD